MINDNPRRQGLKSDTTSKIPGTLHWVYVYLQMLNLSYS